MKLRSLEKIDALTDEQRQQLADWLESHTLDDCVDLVKNEFGTEIPRSTINRFRKRCELADFLDTSPDSARARAEIINAAGSGKPNFSQATVDLLEKQAFELADDTRNPESLRALKDLFGLVLKYENIAVRKRMATVQEGKLKLREQQFERANTPDDTEAKIRDLNKKIAIAFGQHPVLTAIRNAEASASQSRSTGSDAGAGSTSSLAGQISSDDDCPKPPKVLEDAGSSIPSLSSCPSVQNTAPCEAPDQNSALCTFNSALKDHAIRRWRAYLPRPFHAPEPDPSWRDECPCGHPLPCPAHLDLHLRTRYLQPHHADYAAELQDVGVPYYIPTAAELGCSEELLQKTIAKFAPYKFARRTCRSWHQ
jgi:hypothetical protein